MVSRSCLPYWLGAGGGYSWGKLGAIRVLRPVLALGGPLYAGIAAATRSASALRVSKLVLVGSRCAVSDNQRN